MARPIYVRFEGRYWRLSVLLRQFDIPASAGYRRHKAYGCPKVYKKWMLEPVKDTVAQPIEVTIDGVMYPSIKDAQEALSLPKNRLNRRVKKLGRVLTIEQVLATDPSWNGISNLNKKKQAPSEWKALSNKKNTGAARRPSDEWLAFTDRPRAQSHTPY